MTCYEITFNLPASQKLSNDVWFFTFGTAIRKVMCPVVRMTVPNLVDTLNKLDFREINYLEVKEVYLASVGGEQPTDPNKNTEI